jgi:hypothetical protein
MHKVYNFPAFIIIEEGMACFDETPWVPLLISPEWLIPSNGFWCVTDDDRLPRQAADRVDCSWFILILKFNVKDTAISFKWHCWIFHVWISAKASTVKKKNLTRRGRALCTALSFCNGVILIRSNMSDSDN